MSKVKIREESYSELFDLKASARQKTMIKIAHAAIANYASIGPDKTTYESIAKSSQVSRPLVHKYFPNKRDIFLLAAKYVRLEFQRLAIAAIDSAPTPKEKLESYVHSAFEWMDKHHDHVVVWMLFWYECAMDPKIKKLGTELAIVGHGRITQLLKLGADAGIFKLTNAEEQAKQIQGVITGIVVMSMTESPEAMHDGFRRASIETCLRIAGAKIE